jgi:hypothetical protein
MENTQKETEKQELIKELQTALDLLRSQPQYKQYVQQRKLHLINSKYGIFDILLNKGILK